jgi:hypothetical protein
MRAALLLFATLTLAAQDERAFMESMNRLERQDPAAKKDLEDQSPLRAAALAMDPAKASEKDRYAAATWLWATNLIRDFHYGKEQTYLQAARGQTDLLKAWALLETVGGDLTRSRDSIRLELAWRLVDVDRMRSAYAAVSARPDLNVRELVHCFFVSAHLGEWTAMKKHAQALKAQGGKLEGLHAAAENTLTMFDYESLLKAVETGRPERTVGPLAVRSFRITKQRVKIQRITGSDKTLLKESESWSKDWVAKPDATAGLFQVGAAAHWVEGSAQPPVSGFLDGGRLYLVGYRETQGEPSDSGRQEQIWDLHPDPQASGRWRGTNTLTAWRAGTDPKTGPALHIIFDVEWDMRPSETYLESPSVAPSIPVKSGS